MLPSNHTIGDLSSVIIRNLIIDPQSVDEKLMCNICNQIAIDPKECVECQYLFCFGCIKEWTNSHLQCPNGCNSENMEYKDPHRIIKNQYNSLKLRCPNLGCQVTFLMESLNKHLQNCEYQEVKCPNNNCNQMMRASEYNNHKLQCQYIVVECYKCKGKYYCSENHDCIPVLMSKIKQQEQMIEQMQEVQFRANLQMNQLNAKIQKLNEKVFNEQTNLRVCKIGHPLTWIFPIYQQNCNNCNQQTHAIRYECIQCNYQYCQRCVRPEVKTLRCPMWHQLLYYRQSQKNILCDFCSCNPFEQNIGVYHDANCDFDVCANCINNLQQ